MNPVDTQPDFLALEREVLAHWDANHTFEKLRELRRDGPLFRFVDGPITANNPMGVHHAWGRTLKDVFLRYRAMQGFRARYQNGFDCQGLWVEVEVEKALGFKGKSDIEAFGLAEFSKACRDRVNTFAGVITEQSRRLGQWMDWDDSYYTHTDANIAGIWHFLRLCHERGWLYQGSLPMPWCTRCGTSLSEHEMAASYKEVDHLAVWASVPLLDDPNRRLLIWTTTPWTLAANVAAAVHPALDYVEVRRPGDSYTLILGEVAAKRLGKVERVASFKGQDLVGLRYQTFFADLEAQRAGGHRVVPWEDVTATDGTGIVHIAPGCGREDYELGLRLGLTPIRPVNGEGVYGPEFGFLAGRTAMTVAEDVVAELRQRDRLLEAGPHRHSFPFCWRCKGELIFRLVDEWFISCKEVRPSMMAAAEQVAWKPDYMGRRMQDWLSNMGDWCISRKRYWGLPLPFYPCRSCGHLTVIGSREELRRRAVDPARVDGLTELHRPWVDEVAIRCERCDAPVSRVTEVGDCWLDAGIVPYSTQGYFEGSDAWPERYPVEWVCEMREQVRLWYYSMLFMGVTISGRAPYEKVLSYERVVSEDGTTFSKTGFMIRFDEAVDRIGADSMRYLFCQQPVSAECRFGYGPGHIAQRRLLGLWNVYAFYVTYALIDRPRVDLPLESLPLDTTDRWLLARVERLVSTCTRSFDAWDTPAVLREVESFVDELSNWYVRVNRRRFWRNEDQADQLAAYGTLYCALKSVILVLAPIVPFFSEAIWQNLVRGQEADAPESVHHARWPSGLDRWRDEGLLVRTEAARDVIRQGLALRELVRIRTRQPLPALHVKGSEELVSLVREQELVIKTQLNVKEIVYTGDSAEFEVGTLVLDWGRAGPVLRKDAAKAKALLAALGPEEMAEAVAAHAAGAPVVLEGLDVALAPELLVRQSVPDPRFCVSTDQGRTLALDLTLDDALVAEGLARDLIRRLQTLRKESGRDVADRIRVWLQPGSEPLERALRERVADIAEEVLAVSVSFEPRPDGGEGEDVTVQEHPCRAWIGD